MLSVTAGAIAVGVPRVTRSAVDDAARDRNATPAAPPSSATIDTTLARDAAGCAGVRSTVWHPLSGLEYTGRLRLHLPALAGGQVVFFIGDSIPLDVDVESFDGRALAFRQQRLPSGPGVHVPPDFWLDDNAPWNAPRAIVRLSVDANPLRGLDVRVSLGRRAPRVLARLVGYTADAQVPVCAERVSDREIYFASGWYGEENGDFGPIRWMREHGAVLLPSRDGRAVRVRLRAAPAVTPREDDATTLSLRVNDFVDLTPVRMQRGFADYEWDVPDNAWVPGTNELFFSVSRSVARGTRTLGLALASITAR